MPDPDKVREEKHAAGMLTKPLLLALLAASGVPSNTAPSQQPDQSVDLPTPPGRVP